MIVSLACPPKYAKLRADSQDAMRQDTTRYTLGCRPEEYGVARSEDDRPDGGK